MQGKALRIDFIFSVSLIIPLQWVPFENEASAKPQHSIFSLHCGKCWLKYFVIARHFSVEAIQAPEPYLPVTNATVEGLVPDRQNFVLPPHFPPSDQTQMSFLSIWSDLKVVVCLLWRHCAEAKPNEAIQTDPMPIPVIARRIKCRGNPDPNVPTLITNE